MASQGRRSTDGSGGSNSRNGVRRVEDIGWGVGSDDIADLKTRRTLFSVLCSVLIIVGALFFYDALRDGGAEATLRATQGAYAVSLGVFPFEQREKCISTVTAYLAADEFPGTVFTVDRERGVEVYVGRFEDSADEDLKAIADALRSKTGSGGERPFLGARIVKLDGEE